MNVPIQPLLQLEKEFYMSQRKDLLRYDLIVNFIYFFSFLSF